MLIVPTGPCLKFDANIKEMGSRLKNENLIDHERHESVSIENTMQYIVKIENV